MHVSCYQPAAMPSSVVEDEAIMHEGLIAASPCSEAFIFEQ
jgi:hypothetical protein